MKAAINVYFWAVVLGLCINVSCYHQCVYLRLSKSFASRNQARYTVLAVSKGDKSPQMLDASDSVGPRIGVKPLGDNVDSILDETKPLKTYVSSPSSSVFGDLSLQDFSAKHRTSSSSSTMSSTPSKFIASKPLKLKQTQPVDLNGIPPLKPFLFSFVAFVQFLDSDVYPLQRASVVARNLLVGITSLAAGFSGVVGVGLLGLGAQVAWGV
eukprot:gene33984-41126_t